MALGSVSGGSSDRSDCIAAAEHDAATLRIRRDRAEDFSDFLSTDAGQELDGAEAVAVQMTSETADERVLGIGGHPLDDELLARHPERERLPLANERFEALHDAILGVLQRPMAVRIHHHFVKCDRQLHDEVSEVARQRLVLNGVGAHERAGEVFYRLRRL